MGMKVFVLSKKNIDLSRAEVEAHYGSVFTRDRYAFVTTKGTKYMQFAFTKGVYKVLFRCKEKDLFNSIEEYNWDRIIKRKTFKIESDTDKQRIAKIIWSLVDRPKVKLDRPDVVVQFFFIGSQVYATVLIWENKEDFLSRKPHNRPGFYPASLDPQLARCMINLAGSNGGIVDPFCGTGGILIESALLGYRTTGFDWDRTMLEKCTKNLKYFGLSRNIHIDLGDARTFYRKCGAIVCEPPFGRNTRERNLDELYYAFLVNAKRSTKTIVMSFPHWVSWKKIVKKSGWKLDKEFSLYVHKSMTRKIVVLTS
jgi:tRNA (guanine10-N2)-dimethyltransferase